MREVADEPAAQLLERGAHPTDRVRLQPDIVVEEQHVPGPGLVEQEGPMFGKAPPGQVAAQQDRVSPVAQDPHQSGDRPVRPGRSVVGLVGDHHTERLRSIAAR
jgi:hypothetical protein